MTNDPRVLMIGLDAAEPRLVERWMEDGSLPNLRALRERPGSYGRLRSSAEWLVGSPWPTFYTSTPPSEHGLYHYLAWRPERMASARPDADFLPLRPFWRELSARGLRVVAVDVPLTYAPTPFEGVEIAGWATHETLEPPASHPADLMEWIGGRMGPPPGTAERYDLLSVDELLEIRDQLNHATERVGTLASALMARQPWDLFLVGFASTHRGGHKLWDETGTPDAGAGERERIAGALRDVYVAADREIGRLVEAAGPDTTVLVFSVHGMGPNTCRTEQLSEMLRLILRDTEGAAAEPGRAEPGRTGPTPGLVDRLREAIPNRWRHQVKRRLPLALQDRLTTYWRMKEVDWETTRAFSLVADLQGYVRINLRGREASGIVEPGEEYERLCARIERGLRTFRDADTGTPVVADIARTADVFPSGPRRDLLPDLLVRWSDEPAAAHRSLVSPGFGSIPWPTPGRNPSGRSGNHRGEGFLLAAGAPFPAGASLEGADILDLAPTVCTLLGHEPTEAMRGRSLLVSAPTVTR